MARLGPAAASIFQDELGGSRNPFTPNCRRLRSSAYVTALSVVRIP